MSNHIKKQYVIILKNMENESTAEKLLNEGLELLSSEKPQKQKKGFYSLRGATALGHMKAFYYEGVCYKEGLGIYQSDEQAFERFFSSCGRSTGS